MPRGSKAAHRAAVKAAAHPTSGGHHQPAPAPARVILQAKRQPGDPVPELPTWRMTPLSPGARMDRFSHLTFPPYQFREYPKWVKPPTGARVLVHDAEEEALAMGGAELVREEDERARLLLVAEVKGVQVDATWPLARLEKAIADAGHDPSLDPSV